MRRSPARALLAAAATLACTASACGILGGGGKRPELPRGGASARAAERQLVLKRSEDRPAINLVLREGDPAGAGAVAVLHDQGSEASVALAALVEARLGRMGFPRAASRPSQLGFLVHSLLDGSSQAGRFIDAVRRAANTPVVAGEPALAAVAQRLDALGARAWVGAGEMAVAQCSGDLGFPAEVRPLDVRSSDGLAKLERWRAAILSPDNVAFGALGRRDILDAASATLDAQEAWPKNAAASDRWPERDVLAVDGSRDRESELSVALRVPDAAKAVSGARAISEPSAALALRLGALDPTWKIERVVATTRRRGACLRIDLRQSSDNRPDVDDVARAVLVTRDEAQRALAAPVSEAVLGESVLRLSDPREAAAAAAWQALSGQLKPGAVRQFVSYATQQGQAGLSASVELSKAVERIGQKWQNVGFDRRVRVEAGQGEFYALVATPCGSLADLGDAAGSSALAVEALASRHRGGELKLESWVSPDGIGLIAHGPRRNADESAGAHAGRIAAALGRLLLSGPVEGTQLAAAREAALSRVGAKPRSGYWLTIESLAPEHVAWLEPRGSWRSLSELATHDVELRRRALLGGPLRVAILANVDNQQAQVGVAELERWLLPESGATSCPVARLPVAQTGELVLEASGETAKTYLGVALPRITREAEWAAWLLNRPGGWLDQALRLPGLAASAEARLLGGQNLAALVVEAQAPAGKSSELRDQLRGLFQRLAQGAAGPPDVELAGRQFQRLDRSQELDPRRRLIEAWLGPGRDRQADLTSLRRFLATALAPSRHVIVRVEPRNPPG